MGYVGSVLVPYLASLGGYEIHGFDLGYFERNLTGPCPEYFLAKQHRGDVRTFPEKLLENFDAVIHLAALSNDAMGVRFNSLTQEVNYQASVRLAKLAKQAGVLRFVFASSCSVYGAAGDGSSRSEQDPTNPLTAYAKSKILVEQDLKQLASPDFQVSALRFATACGPSSRLRLDLVLNDFVATAITQKKIKIQSDGSPMRPLIHVRDMARAMDWAVNRAGDNYLVLNIGSEIWNYSILELAEHCKDLIPGVEIERNPAALKDQRSYQVDFQKFKNLAPHHQPLRNIEMTVEALSRLCQNLDLTDRDKYVRLAVLNNYLSGGDLKDSFLRESLSPSKLTLA